MTDEQTADMITALNNLGAALKIVNDNIVEVSRSILSSTELLKCGIDKVDRALQEVWGTQKSIKALKTGLNAILDLVGEDNELLRGECAARDREAKHREKCRENMRRRRGVSKHEITEKEKKTEKEPSPHTPYKEKKEDKVKEPLHACAREEGSISHDDGTEKVDGEFENDKNSNLETPKKKRGRKPFKKPTEEEVAAYIKERGFHFSAHTFWSFYESKGWMVGSNKMTKWRSACEAFEARKNRKPSGTSRPTAKKGTPGVILHSKTESALSKMGGLF